MSLEKPMTREESYVQRRELFKNIWEAALDVNEKEDILKKPKVIKTLRMDEIDKCPIGKAKKERIRNLRHVCNKILDFCNRQDADDTFYEKIAAAGANNTAKEASPASPTKLKRAKVRVKRKFKKVKSAPQNAQTFQPNVITAARVEQKTKVEEIKEEDSVSVASSSSSSKLSTKPEKKIKRKVCRIKTKKSIKSDDVSKEGTVKKRKVLKRKRHVKKHKSVSSKASPQIISV